MRARYAAFATLVAGATGYYSQTYVVGEQTTRVEAFSLLAIPALAVLVHFALLSVLPFRAYVAAAVADYLFLLAVATNHGYYRDNLDVHVILQNWREGLPFAAYIVELVPKTLMTVAALVVATQCWLARRLDDATLNRRIVGGLSAALAVPYALALQREPPGRAALNQDYALCIKLYGYYGAMLGDLLATGVFPTQGELADEFRTAQARAGSADRGWGFADGCDRSVIAIQVESLDSKVALAHWQGQPVAPFLAGLRSRAAYFRVDPGYSEASGTSGADFQVLTGLVPHPRVPVYSVTGIDYGEALPRLFSSRGVESFAFVGVTRNFFSQGAGFERAGFTRYFDQSAYPSSRARWGIDDETFLRWNAEVVNRQRRRAFYLLITLSSHGPFDLVDHARFPARTLAGRYFNAINYVDLNVRRFVESLGGRHLVFLYGDHAANIRSAEYSSADAGGLYVPLFVFLLDDGEVRSPALVGDTAEASQPLPLRSLYWLIRRSALDGCTVAK